MICQREFGVWPFIFYRFEPDRNESPNEFGVFIYYKWYKLKEKHFRLDFCVEQGVAQESLRSRFKLDKILGKIQSYISESCSKPWPYNVKMSANFILKISKYSKRKYRITSRNPRS
jgi:hypothetical protein